MSQHLWHYDRSNSYKLPEERVISPARSAVRARRIESRDDYLARARRSIVRTLWLLAVFWIVFRFFVHA